ncbi:prostate-associated microseminoprotein [Takifugu flavidus]|uniref:prostate-associated microseminoprotein n=1 Tax=Takifugu flavidus TaxID=433684 RepID=UPI0025442319|nr:prostate-associated microseminoprotein [Takifugu flavidus]XP_056884164.1 prostate-associated microseminoprotein [Takifugu flavidus]XP_056884165.1 prostate-associated microseminoprotein [Takifugu flavidus]
MKMELSVVHFVLAASGFLLWVGGSSAAPMVCNFDSRALCVFEGKNYSMGDSWMDNACLQCTCLHPVGVGCCETVHRPVDFPAWCQVQVEPVSCRVSLVQTVDPRLPCFPGDSMQDPSHGSPRLQQQLQG